MSLPKDYYTASIQDIRSRFRNSIIALNDTPFYVKDVSMTPIGATSTSPFITKPVLKGFTSDLRNDQESTIDNKDLSIVGLGARLGFFNLSNDMVGCFTRIPINGMAQGLTRHNLLMKVYYKGTLYTIISPTSTFKQYRFDILNKITISKSDLDRIMYLGNDYNIRYEMLAALRSPWFLDSFKNKYPSVQEVLDLSKPHVTAVSKTDIIERDDFGDVYVIHKGDKIGKMSQDRVKLLPTKTYLTQEIERKTGLKAI